MIKDMSKTVQDLQLKLLQDFFELQMSEEYGDKWLGIVIDKCTAKYAEGKQNNPKKGEPDYAEEKQNNPKKKLDYSYKYKKIAMTVKNKGPELVDKKSFDVTLLNVLICIDFPNECRVKQGGEDKLKNHIRTIVNDKNGAVSHTSDCDDVLGNVSEQMVALRNLRDFLTYLERAWGPNVRKEKREFLKRYQDEIGAISGEITGAEAKSVIDKLLIEISVCNKNGVPVPGFGLALYDSKDNLYAGGWTSTGDREEPWVVSVEPGSYVIKETKHPEGYRASGKLKITVDKDHTKFIKYVERSISDDELYRQAFNGLYDDNKAIQMQSIQQLKELEKANHIESCLLLAFILHSGLYGEKDEKSAGEILQTVDFLKDPEEWRPEAERLRGQKDYAGATAYYLGFSMKTNSPEGYYMVGRICLKMVKNYSLCLKCFEIAAYLGRAKEGNAYKVVKAMSKAEYLKR